ncbi:MAG: TetR/AcrR family transcriptional regulator [Acidimicrobiales bacterium]
MGTVLVDRMQNGPVPAIDVHALSLGPRAAPVGSSPSPQQSGSRARVIAAALGCIERFGVSKTTVDDVVRAAGLSRATLYRAFPGGRDEVLRAVADTEIRRFLDEMAERLDTASNLEELLVAVLSGAADRIAAHETLRSLLVREPEVIVPFLSFHGFDLVLALASDFLDPYLTPVLGRPQARRVAEWLTRLVISHVACPPGALDHQAGPGPAVFAIHPEPIGQERARRLVAQFVLPGIQVLSGAEGSAPSPTAIADTEQTE